MSEIPSYRKINYTLRPAKNIERKMIAEACSRLATIMPLRAYRYIGFGSPFFSDFRLFHRTLGFSPMINIEAETDDEERFDFNKPFECVRMVYGKSSEVLPSLQWQDLPTVIWLDYDTQLSKEILDDIGYLMAILQAMSLIIITVRRKASDFGDGKEKLTAFEAEFGESLPPAITQRHLAQSRFSTTLRMVINENIAAILGDRNAALPEENQFEYRQIFNFVYDDGTPMLTVGGVLTQRSDRARFDSCDLNSLDFCRTGSDHYEIIAPSLTYKEQRHLDSQLPGSSPESPGVPPEDIEAYRRVYRYFPTFTEVEL